MLNGYDRVKRSVALLEKELDFQREEARREERS
jgi:hypothetical protein